MKSFQQAVTLMANSNTAIVYKSTVYNIEMPDKEYI